MRRNCRLFFNSFAAELIFFVCPSAEGMAIETYPS